VLSDRIIAGPGSTAPVSVRHPDAAEAIKRQSAAVTIRSTISTAVS
jgi:hypothetical protein